MLSIDITKIPIVFISPCIGKYLHRCEQTKLLLKNDIKSTNWSLHQSELIYPNGLKNAFLSILKQDILSNSLNPLLILEDDVSLNSAKSINNLNLNNLIIPQDADALYLGNAAVGNGTFPFNSVHSSKLNNFESINNNNLYKVLSMRSAHAIVYITDKYKKAVFEAVLNDINQPHYDVTLANIQNKFNVYAYDIAPFYQAGQDVNSRLTRTSLNKINNERFAIKILIGIITLIFIFYLIKFVFVKRI